MFSRKRGKSHTVRLTASQQAALRGLEQLVKDGHLESAVYGRVDWGTIADVPDGGETHKARTVVFRQVAGDPLRNVTMTVMSRRPSRDYQDGQPPNRSACWTPATAHIKHRQDASTDKLSEPARVVGKGLMVTVITDLVLEWLLWYRPESVQHRVANKLRGSTKGQLWRRKRGGVFYQHEGDLFSIDGNNVYHHRPETVSA